MGQMIARRYWEQRMATKLAETETTSSSKPFGARTRGDRKNTAPAASSSNDAALSSHASASDGKPAISNETSMSTQAVNSTKDIGSANPATKVDKTDATEKTSAPSKHSNTHSPREAEEENSSG
jgi:hypothetical protein